MKHQTHPMGVRLRWPPFRFRTDRCGARRADRVCEQPRVCMPGETAINGNVLDCISETPM